MSPRLRKGESMRKELEKIVERLENRGLFEESGMLDNIIKKLKEEEQEIKASVEVAEDFEAKFNQLSSRIMEIDTAIMALVQEDGKGKDASLYERIIELKKERDAVREEERFLTTIAKKENKKKVLTWEELQKEKMSRAEYRKNQERKVLADIYDLSDEEREKWDEYNKKRGVKSSVTERSDYKWKKQN